MQPNFVGVYCLNFVLNFCRFHGCRASWTAGWNPTMGWLQKTGLFVAVCAYCERCSLNLQVSYSNAKQLSHTFVYWTQSRHIYITRCLVHRGVCLKIARDMRRGWRDMSWRRCQHLDGWHLLWNEHLRSLSSSTNRLYNGLVICVPAGCTRKIVLGGTMLLPVAGSTSTRLSNGG